MTNILFTVFYLVIIDFLSEFVIFCKQICGKSIQQ